jgi:hypothetical protein
VPFARKMKALGLEAKLKVTHTSSTFWYKMQNLTFLPNALNNWERFDMRLENAISYNYSVMCHHLLFALQTEEYHPDSAREWAWY